MCYNETECYDCTQGYYLTENGECQRKLSENIYFTIYNIVIYLGCLKSILREYGYIFVKTFMNDIQTLDTL